MKTFAFLALAGALVACQPAVAQRETAPPAPRPAERASPDRWAELTRDATHHEGYFDLYVTEDKLYLAVPPERLGHDFLMEAKLAQGIGARGLYGGAMLNTFEADVVALERHGDRVYLLKRPHRYRAEEGTPAADAVELAFASSVMESARIEATSADSTLLIEIREWVVSDLADLSRRVRMAISPRPGQPGAANVDRTRSYLESVKAFPRNVNLRARLTFRPSQPVPIPAVPDDRYLSLAVHYTLAELPAEPMTPRVADERMGYFMTVHKDFSSEDSTHFARFINRWRLEPGEPAGDGLVYPKQPIVYYLDRTIPHEYRPYFIEGIEAWNKAFERAGFKDAIRAEPLPDDADADDIRYPTLRWSTSDQPGYGAIGPSTVDPRTGEILDANQLYEANMILGFRRAWQNLVSPQVALEVALGVVEDPHVEDPVGGHLHFAEIVSAQGSLLRAALAARGEIGPDEPVPAEYVGEAIRWVVMHEVGHTLGLRHNFRSSTETPVEMLHDREWARTRGLVGSVMDYHAPNVAPPREPQGYFYSPTVGSADEWKIAFGYTPDPAAAERIAREAGLDGHGYGTDEDTRGPGAMDPSVNVYDLSADPLAWGRERARLIADLWTALPRHVLTDNARYADLTSAFQALLGQYAQALAPAVKYVGGQYVFRTRVGDVNDRGPFQPIARDEQLEALAFLNEHAFSAEAFRLPADVLARFGPNRWNHWGQSNTFDGRIDFPFHEQVLGIQSRLLAELLHPFRMARIRDAELRHGAGNVLTIPELMLELTRTIWSEVWEGPGVDVPALRRDLQRAHLERMAEIVATAEARMPADARAVARLRLNDLNRRLDRRLANPARYDDYTLAHFLESQAMIEKALRAGLELELR